MNNRNIKLFIFAISNLIIIFNFGFNYSQNEYKKIVLSQEIKSLFNESTVKGIIDKDSENFEYGRYFNTHIFEGIKNQLITIEIDSKDFEPNFMLVDSNWNEIEIITVPINKSKYRALLKLPYTGTYKVLATSNYFGKTGQYSLNLYTASKEDILKAKVVSDAIEQADRLSRESFKLDQEKKREEAIPIANKAIEIYRQQLGARNPFMAAKLINFGLLYKNLLRYSEAESIYLEALEINRETLGSRHPQVALNLNSLAGVIESQGRYSEAELLYIEALEINREQLEPFHPHVASALSNLAGLYFHQGRYDEMKPLLDESITICEELKDESKLSFSLGWLAFMHKAQHNYEEAIKITKKTLDIIRKHHGENHNGYAIDLNNLGLLYNAQGRYHEAEPLFKQALDIYLEVLELGERHVNFGTSLNSLGKSYHYQKKYIKAESSYKQALDIFREQLGDKHPDTALSLNNLAELHFTQENIQQAIEFLTQGIKVEEYNISENLIPGSEKQKKDYIAKISASTNLAVSLNFQSISKNSNATNLALTTILQRKGRILDTLTNSLQILRQQTDDPQTKKLLTNYSNLRNQYSNLVFRKPEDIKSPDIHHQQLIQLETQTKQLEDKLSRRSAEFRELSEPITLEKIQKLIPQNSALVELVRYQPFNPQETIDTRWGEPRYAAYILHSEGQPQAIDLGEAQPIDKATDKFRKTLCTTTEPTKSSIENCIKNLPIPRVKASARELEQMVMQPVRELLGETKNILLSPDSKLNLVPFEALVDENNQYLVENYNFTYLTSGRDLMRLQHKSPSESMPLIIADPLYSEDTNLVANNRSIENISQLFGKLSFARLPETETEAKAIQSQLNLPAEQIKLRNEATESVLKQVKSPEILHIATHGFFLDKPITETALKQESPLQSNLDKPITIDNPLFRSGLVLAKEKPDVDKRKELEESETANDGVLTAYETTFLDLTGTKLVVLSACDTGVGDISTGEGIYGLRRALVIAGSESQVISLWKVVDEGTKDLMTAYYEQLKQGKGRTNALHEVQRKMLGGELKGDNEKSYEHPYYWASFIPSGEWTSMKLDRFQ